MNKKITIFIMLILIVSFCGCTDQNGSEQSDSDMDLFVGTWKHNLVIGPPDLPAATVEIITLYSNGTGEYNGNIQWWIENDQFIIVRGENQTSYEYQFSDSNTKVELSSNGDTQVWMKQ